MLQMRQEGQLRGIFSGGEYSKMAGRGFSYNNNTWSQCESSCAAFSQVANIPRWPAEDSPTITPVQNSDVDPDPNWIRMKLLCRFGY